MPQIDIVFTSIANSSQTDPHLLDYQIWFLFFSVFTKSNLYHPITLECMVRSAMKLSPTAAAGGGGEREWLTVNLPLSVATSSQ